MSSTLALAHQPGPLPAVRKLRLAAEALVVYARVRVLLRRLDLPSVIAALRDGADVDTASPSPEAHAAALRFARATSRTLAILPSDTRCLMRALVLMRLLARRGSGARVVIGVSPGEEFGAHAWVELGGRPLLPPGEDTFQRLVEL